MGAQSGGQPQGGGGSSGGGIMSLLASLGGGAQGAGAQAPMPQGAGWQAMLGSMGNSMLANGAGGWQDGPGATMGQYLGAAAPGAMQAHMMARGAQQQDANGIMAGQQRQNQRIQNRFQQWQQAQQFGNFRNMGG